MIIPASAFKVDARKEIINSNDVEECQIGGRSRVVTYGRRSTIEWELGNVTILFTITILAVYEDYLLLE